jgi:hypothetical protein
MPNQDAKLLDKRFSPFFQKTKDEEGFCKTIGDALIDSTLLTKKILKF